MMHKIAVIFGFVATVGAVANPFDDVRADREACLVVGSVEACERWERAEPETSGKYWGQVWTGNGWSVASLADFWGVDAEVIANIAIELLVDEAVQSVDRFNPYSVDFKNADDFEQSKELNDDQKWKWLRYRRAEIGICFEDEFLNAEGQCEID